MSEPQTTTPLQQAEGEQEEDSLWEAAAEGAGAGESPDSATRDVLGLVHRAIDRFPELAGRYRKYAGPAAVVSGALIALAGVAVARRVRLGEHPQRILEELTSAEIESAARVEHQEHKNSRPRPLRPSTWRRRKKGEESREASAEGG